MKKLAFWMELNTPMKILAFCISSFQSSWHFAFYISCELETAKEYEKVNMNLFYDPLIKFILLLRLLFDLLFGLTF
jgi:hypothetical protein